MKRVFLLLTCFCALNSRLVCYAQNSPKGFVKTNLNTWQDISGQYSNQIINTSGNKIEGIFINIKKSSSSQSALQEFSVKDLKSSENFQSLFIEHNGEHFSKLYVGKNSWQIRGVFSIETANLKIVCDNNVQYLTIYKKDTNTESLLGFIRLNPVINISGLLSKLFEANSYEGIIVPYQLKNSELFLGTKKIEANNSIGIEPEQVKNPCFSNNNVAFLSSNIIQKITLEKKPTKRRNLIKEQLDKSTDPRKYLILLKSSTEVAIVFNTSQATFSRITPLNRKKLQEDEARLICRIEKIDLEY